MRAESGAEEQATLNKKINQSEAHKPEFTSPLTSSSKFPCCRCCCRLPLAAIVFLFLQLVFEWLPDSVAVEASKAADCWLVADETGTDSKFVGCAAVTCILCVPPSRHSLGSTIYTTIQFGCERTLCITTITLTLACSALFVFLCFSSSRDFLFSSASPLCVLLFSLLFISRPQEFLLWIHSLTEEQQSLASSSFRERVHLHCPLLPRCLLSSNATLLLFRYFVNFFWHNQQKNSIKRQVGPTGRKEKSNRFMQENDENKSINGEFLARQRDD